MLSCNVAGGLTADVTCSVCRGIFDRPKIMPNCPHTFCLRCLQQMPIERTNPPKIRCPECRQLNNLPKVGVEGFLVNLAVQNIVEKLKTQQGETVPSLDADTTVCNHTEKRDTCRHCLKDFCHSCKYRHMDELKEKISILSKIHHDLVESLNAQNVFSKMNSAFEREAKSVQASMAMANSALEKRTEAIVDAVAQFQIDEGSRIRRLFDMLTDKKELASIEEKRLRLAAISFFRLPIELDDIVQLHEDFAKRNKQLELLTSLRDGDSSLLSFEPKDVTKLLDDLDLGTFKLTPSGEKLQCTLPPQLKSNTNPNTSTGLQDHSLPSNSNAASSLPSAHATSLQPLVSPSGPASLPPPFQFDHSAYFVFDTSDEIDHVRRIVGDIGNNGYIVAHNDDSFTLFDHLGVVGTTFYMEYDEKFSTFRIDDMTTDLRKTIFFAANITDDRGRQLRSIYRFWVNDADCNEEEIGVEPCLFVKSSYRNCFRGLAVSKRWRWLITTDREDVVAYESIDALKNELGTLVYRCELGPSPYVHGAHILDESVSLKIVCSTEGVLRCLDIYSSDKNRTTYKYWPMDNNSDNLMKAKSPSHFCYWDNKALLVIDDSIQQYSGLPDNPVLEKTFPLSLASSPTKDKCVGIAGVTVHVNGNSRGCFAVIYNSGIIQFALLTNS